MHSLLDGATGVDLSVHTHGSTTGQASCNQYVCAAVSLNSVSLTDDVVSNGRSNAQAVEAPVGGIKVVTSRC